MVGKFLHPRFGGDRCRVPATKWNGARASRWSLRERDFEHRDDDFVPVDVIDKRQAVMMAAVRSQHKPFGRVSVLSSPDLHKFVRCAIKGTDGAESFGARIEARAKPSIGATSDEPAGPVLLVRDDLEGAGYDLLS
jgi:hypothetical protein